MTQHHDPVHPDSPHLTAEMVADLDEGLLDTDSATHAETHLTHCATCRELRARIADVSQALGSLPPIPMPEDRAAALESALAALPPGAQPLAVPDAMPDSSDTVVPLEAGRRSRAGWSTRFAAVAASAAGVLLVSAVGLSVMSSGGSDGVDGAGVDAALERADAQPSLAGFRADQSGGAYRTKTLDEQVDTLLVSYAQGSSDVATPEPSAAETGEPAPTVTATVRGEPTTFAAPMANAWVVHACIVDYLERPDTVPLAVDIGTFDGAPAAVVVLPALDDDARAEVYVVAPDCSGPDATLLYWAMVDLPDSFQR